MAAGDRAGVRSRILDRSMIYTALTRAQEQVIFLGNRKALDAAVRRPPAAERRDVGFGDWLTLARARSDKGRQDRRFAAHTSSQGFGG